MSCALSSSSWPPHPQRQSSTCLDNLALVPASELHALHHWQEQARRLPAGDTLVVVPNGNLKLHEVVRRLDLVLRRRGRHSYIATITSPKQIQS